MNAEGILMHRSKNIIALRATQGTKTVIQVFNLDTKTKLKHCEVDETVRFWKWIGEDTLGIVGKSSVFHTNITDTETPTKVFDQESKFQNCQIMNYGVDKSDKWCYLIGIYQGTNQKICCHMQLFFIEKKQQQILSGFAATFTDMPISDNTEYKNSLFCFSEQKEGETTQKLHIMEIGTPAPGATGKFKVSANIPMQQEGDFPVLMQDAPKYGVIFIITKFGYLFMYEVSTASLLHKQKFTD
jgi:clathrin heavy chain